MILINIFNSEGFGQLQCICQSSIVIALGNMWNIMKVNVKFPFARNSLKNCYFIKGKQQCTPIDPSVTLVNVRKSSVEKFDCHCFTMR